MRGELEEVVHYENLTKTPGLDSIHALNFLPFDLGYKYPIKL